MVIQLARLGDLVQTIPLLKALQTGSRHIVTLVIDKRLEAGISSSIPADEIIPVDLAGMERECRSGGVVSGFRNITQGLAKLRGKRYDRVYNLNFAPLNAAALSQVNYDICKGFIPAETPGDFRHSAPFRVMFLQGHHRRFARVHLSDLFRFTADNPPVTRPPFWRVTEKGRELGASAVGTLKRRGAQTVVALHLGAGAEIRRWGDENFAELISLLRRMGDFGFILAGSAGESRGLRRELEAGSPVLDMTGKTDIDALAGTLAAADLLVGADSGPLQLAAAVGTKTLGLYFASAFVFETGPIGEGHFTLQVFPQCAPCLEDAPECGDVRCRNLITPEIAAETVVNITENNLDALTNLPLPDDVLLFRSEVDGKGQTYRLINGKSDEISNEKYREMWLEMCRENGAVPAVSAGEIAEMESRAARMTESPQSTPLAQYYYLVQADEGSAAAAAALKRVLEIHEPQEAYSPVLSVL